MLGPLMKDRDMSLSEKIAPLLPLLRRYARALTGTQASGDAYVKATLQAIVADPSLVTSNTDLRVQLYAVFQKIWTAGDVEVPAEPQPLTSFEAIAGARLSQVTPIQRQALLLKTLEGFDMAQTAVIMDTTDQRVEDLVEAATKELTEQTRAEVLIIEDEPIIAMDLEEIVGGMGHTVTSIAATRDEAVAAAETQKPSLVLADIHLADGSSGIDAVKDILGKFSVPVIFITAFPERLLTGERPEPTFLITKPFLSTSVQAAIGQALFFNQPEKTLA